MVDLIMDWDDAVQIVRSLGWGEWFKHVSTLFPDHQLYSTSQDWFTHGSEYVAKFKGAMGDVIVGWHK